MDFRGLGRGPKQRAAASVGTICLAAGGLVLACSGGAAGASSAAPSTALVSVARNGTPAGTIGLSSSSISANGRYVAFDSWASTLVAGDTNNAADIFVRDMKTGAIRRVSVSSKGAQALGTGLNGSSLGPSISSDGNLVAFESYAANLVPGDTNGAPDIFVRNLKAGTTRRVSVSNSGAQANGQNVNSWMLSGNGRYVVFDSDASNLVAGDTNGQPDVFVRDLKAGTTRRVSVSNTGGQANNFSGTAAISSDGHYVAFYSAASNLVPGVGAGGGLYVRDLQAGTTRFVGSSEGGPASFSGNGRYLAFTSEAALVAGDSNNLLDVYVKDLQGGGIRRASVSSGGAQGGGSSLTPSISADGRYVAFESYAANLVAGDTNACSDRGGNHSCIDIFVRDLTAGSTRRVDVSTSGAQANGDSGLAAISADGRYVVFESVATTLVPGQTYGSSNVYRRGPVH